MQRDPNDFKEDELLGRLINQVPLDGPSEGFVDLVMDRIRTAPAIAPQKQPVFLFIRTFFPYVLLAGILIFILWTSDIPFLEQFPGSSYFSERFWPYLLSLFSRDFIQNFLYYLTFALMILVPTVILLLIDRLWIHRSSVFHRFN
jgi:hypothetical protein